MEIVVKGRHTAVPERFRSHVEAKLAKLERYDGKVMRVDVELSREHNRRMSDVRERVELTVYTRGPVIRAEASAADPYSALDGAAGKLAERLRRAADRRVDHLHGNGHGHGRAYVSQAVGLHGELAAPPPGGLTTGQETLPGSRPASAAEGAAPGRPGNAQPLGTGSNGQGPGAATEQAASDTDQYELPDRSPMLVRTKTHRAGALTLDDALSNMELVGHDFYLFQDAVSGRPSVVYRRRGYDYGVIHLIGPDDPMPASDEEREQAGAGSPT